MKHTFIILTITALLLSCKQNKHEDHADATASDAIEVSENQVLYNEVMQIHDEVMPKGDDILRKKEELKNKIANTPTMPEEEKQKIEAQIVQLDSAWEGMMVWMREFNPLPDSTGEERAREYLENEMERVKKVRENILTALQEAEQY
jgi:hypothetical protein